MVCEECVDLKKEEQSKFYEVISNIDEIYTSLLKSSRKAIKLARQK